MTADLEAEDAAVVAITKTVNSTGEERLMKTKTNVKAGGLPWIIKKHETVETR